MDQSRNFGRAGSMYDHGRAVSTVRTPVGQIFSAERRLSDAGTKPPHLRLC